ncbi:MAG TPA: YetF domain-containing protein [Steroidobacteraceae bacterium]|nr:YetF domain-containing protein [Steroidobacteraceae bacterium]
MEYALYIGRAIGVFVFGLIAIRLFGRRAFGEQSPLDIVIAIMVGSNLSRAVTGNAKFFPTLAATASMLLLYWVMSHAAARVSWLSRWVKGRPVVIAHDGELDRRAMKRVGVSEGDIEESARQSGIEELGKVADAFLERNGKISVLPRRSP